MKTVALSTAEIDAALAQLDGWTLEEKSISKTFTFNNYWAPLKIHFAGCGCDTLLRSSRLREQPKAPPPAPDAYAHRVGGASQGARSADDEKAKFRCRLMHEVRDAKTNTALLRFARKMNF